MKRVLWLVLAMLLICSVSVSALAADGGYTYTVRFFSGQQGSFSGGDVVTFEGLHYGDRVTFNQSAVSLNDGSKYYIKGIRESGKDNNTVSATSFIVTGDMDYVVAYGILGSAVAYTVHYQDENGTELAAPETYYGNVGDRPVIAYLYIDGYQPQAYNLIKTLREDASENVLTFVYTPISASETEQTTDTSVRITPPPSAVGQDETDDVSQTGENQSVNREDNDSGAEEQNTEPWEIIDLDDPDTPLANLELEGQGTDSSDTLIRTVGWAIPICLAAAVVLAALLILEKQKKEEQMEDE